MKKMPCQPSLTIFGFAALLTGPVMAGQLVYHPVNPNFGGSPLNGSVLLNEANAQNVLLKKQQTNANAASASTQSLSDQFIRTLESSLLSGLAQQVTNAIFPSTGSGPTSGKVVFGDQEVDFSRGLENITLNIINRSTGATTSIQVPNARLQ